MKDRAYSKTFSFIAFETNCEKEMVYFSFKLVVISFVLWTREYNPNAHTEQQQNESRQNLLNDGKDKYFFLWKKLSESHKYNIQWDLLGEGWISELLWPVLRLLTAPDEERCSGASLLRQSPPHSLTGVLQGEAGSPPGEWRAGCGPPPTDRHTSGCWGPPMHTLIFQSLKNSWLDFSQSSHRRTGMQASTI